MSFWGSASPWATSLTFLRTSAERSMTLPVAVFFVVRFFTVTVPPCVPFGSVAGDTSKPAVAVSVMSVVRFSAETVNVRVALVPSMVSSSSEVFSLANIGAYAPDAS